MSAQWLVLLAIFLPFVGALGIALCGRLGKKGIYSSYTRSSITTHE